MRHHGTEDPENPESVVPAAVYRAGHPVLRKGQVDKEESR